MDDVVVDSGRDVARFDPKKTKLKIIKLDALAEVAKQIKDWPLLEDAIEAKIDEQVEFCAWWVKRITPHEGRHGKGNSVTELRPNEIEEWKRTVYRWRRYLEDKKAYRARLLGAEYRAALLQDKTTYEDHENENDEMFTPEKYIDAAKRVLGEIDLDPASCDKAQETIQAKHYFTKKDNGLSKEWRGRIWLNPPYSDPWLYDFVDKLVRDLISGHVTAAILLTNSSTDTAWFHNAESIAKYICFTRGRVHFLDALQGEKMPTRGQAFFYFGEDGERFGEVFRDFGFVR